MINHQVVFFQQHSASDKGCHVPHGSADVGGLHQGRQATQFGSGWAKIFGGSGLVGAPQYIFAGRFGQQNMTQIHLLGVQGRPPLCELTI